MQKNLFKSVYLCGLVKTMTDYLQSKTMIRLFKKKDSKMIMAALLQLNLRKIIQENYK